MHVFNANLEWSAPKTVELKKTDKGYGFSVIGSAPVIIQSVEEQGPAKVCLISVILLSVILLLSL